MQIQTSFIEKYFFSEDKRLVYFNFGPPHLLFEGFRIWEGYWYYVKWGFFFNIKPYKWHFLEGRKSVLKLLPKITYEHSYLIPYFAINAR